MNSILLLFCKCFKEANEVTEDALGEWFLFDYTKEEEPCR